MTDEAQRTPAEIERAIDQKREVLAADIELLRDTVHERLSVRAQIARHPRIALTVVGALSAFLGLMLLSIGRAVRGR